MDSKDAVDVGIERLRKQMTALIFFATVLGFLCGFVWLTPYWMTFDVNVLQYLTAADIIKHTLPWILVAATAISLAWFFPPVTRESQASVTKVDRRLAVLSVTLSTSLFALAALNEIRQLMLILLWIPLAVLAGEWCFKRLRQRATFTFLSDKALRLFTLGIPTCLIALFALSITRAESITRGTEYRVATLLSAKTKDWLTASGPDNQRPRFIGQAGDYLFLYEPLSKSTIVIRLDAGDSYQLRLVVADRKGVASAER
jgi:hypothetical protein